MKLMWTEKAAEFHGQFVDFDPVWVEPKPKSRPHPPVYIGASSTWAIERLVEYGDGWLPVLGTCDLDERMDQMRRLCDEKGRDPAEIDISIFAAPADKGAMEALAKQGVGRIIPMLPSVPEAEALPFLDQYADLVSWAAELS
jgi:alkanesulfonate monooxygenase SsuD/methylene tetrahydromethanopterin reductase-like flavin-dependent oxidoreductase (luciferase family)